MERPGPSEAVRRLFNEKASSWQRKYGPGGALSARLARFRAELESRGVVRGSVLDFGCGTGDLAAHLASSGYSVTACDIAEEMLRRARTTFGESTVRWVELDGTSPTLPFDDETFDAVVASSVFEYLPNVAPLAREIRRVLRPDGLFALTVPDVRHPIRILETLLRPLAERGMIERVPGLGPYSQYLKLSRNRSSSAAWREQLRACGLEGLESQSWQPSTRSPLVMLSFRRR